MTNLMQQYEKKQIKKIASRKNIPAFRSGDTLKVTVKIVEGERSRIQVFEGICIARKNNSINSKFTVRKISHGEGVERVFPLLSPIIEKIEVVRKGHVRKAKLYYLRERTGKSARIADRDRGDEADQYVVTENGESESNENKKNIPISSEVSTTKAEEILNEKISPEPATEPVVEEKKPVREKSESTASEADKAKDESKS